MATLIGYVRSSLGCSLSVSCVAATGANTALLNFEIVFLKDEFIFINPFLELF